MHATTIITIVFYFCYERQVGARLGKALKATPKRWTEQTGLWASQAAGGPSPPCSEQDGRPEFLSTNPFCRFRESWLFEELHQTSFSEAKTFHRVKDPLLGIGLVSQKHTVRLT